MQRQGRSGAEARKVPVVSPILVQPAPSWAVTLAARQVSARLAQGKAVFCPGICQIGPLSRAGTLPFWRRTRPFQTRACRWTRLSCLVFPRGGSLPHLLCPWLPGVGVTCLLEVLAQGLVFLSWVSGQEPRHAGTGPNHLHMSAGERTLGNLHLSGTCWAPAQSASACGAASPTQGPWEPCVLHAVLSLCFQATAREAIQLPLLSL